MGFENLTGWNDLTEEQRTALVALRKSARWNGIKLSSKFVGLFFASVAFIGLVNGLYVNSIYFGFAAGAVNGIFISRYLISSLKKEHDRISLEVKKILKA